MNESIINNKKSFIGILKSILGFGVIFFGASMIGQIIIVIVTSIIGIDIYSIETDSTLLEIIQLFSFIVFIFGSILYGKYIEKRSLKSMGFIKNGFLKPYLKGIIIGVVLISFVIISSLTTNALFYNGFSEKLNGLYLLLFLIAYITQGMGEEVLCRGYLMTSLLKKTSIFWAILLSSLFFTLPHLPALLMSDLLYGLIGFINTMLFSIFVSILFIRKRNIWLISAIHSAWNYILGTICGINISGNKNSTSLLSFTTNESREIFNGASYGLEAGVFTTIILIISLIFVCFLMKNEK